MSTPAERRKRCKQASEALLGFIHKKDGVTEMLADLEQRFPGPAGVLDANAFELRREGLSESEAQMLSMIPELTRYAQRREYKPHPKLATLSAAVEFAQTLYIGVTVEQFYVLCLDSSGRLIECRMLQQGTVDETPFYVSHLLQAAVTSDARAVVLCHNHPAGTLRPSNADIQSTLDALQALYPLQITLLDHIIICHDKFVSLRDLSYITPSVWIDQNSSSPLLRNWLDIESPL